MAPPSPSPLPTNLDAQNVQQFLSTALSQRGPSSLPYAEDVKWHIRQHLVALSNSYPTLRSRSSTFTHNDGRTVNLLQAEGTIPIVYHGAVYNLPATIWLLEHYPRSPPSVFLSPTRDMVIKHDHPNVDRSGAVSVPYLRSWIFPSSNLAELVSKLSHLFGQNPPLYSRQPPSPPQPPIPDPSPPAPSLTRFFSSPYGGRLPPSPQPIRQHTDDAAQVFTRNAMAKLLDTVHTDIIALRKNREAEMEGLFATQAELRRREEELFSGLREMVHEKEALEQHLQFVLMNSDILDSWLRENDGKVKKIGEVNVDDVFEPVDVLSRQMIECTAADMAIEDAIYSLDKAMQEGAVPFEMYLKSVRALSRDQFFHRALGNKVRATQLQAQVTSMAARVPQYSS